jgi:hypothetical protein
MSRMPAGRERFGGPRLVAATSVALAALCASLLVVHGDGEEGLGVLARVTARVALVIFVVAYAASPLRRLWRTPVSAWLVRNRRYVGLGFAVSMAFHALAILALALRLGDGFEIEPLTFSGGALAYLFTALQAATSSDRAVAALGPRRWRALHRAGLHVIWLVFAVTELPAALYSPLHAALAGLLIGAAALRFVARVRYAAPPAGAGVAPPP